MATSNFCDEPKKSSCHCEKQNRSVYTFKTEYIFPLQIKLSAKLFSLKEIPVFKDLSFSSSQNN